ncbi:MAG TPA: ATP-binding protein [Longimicrobiales bacterium]|nr:ATP-binding protein [Longimicrobiales bacterium]
MRRPAPRWTWVLWLTTLAAVTAGLFVARDRLNEAHVTLAFLLVVLGGSAQGGRLLGFTLAALAFLAFDWLFLSPYYTLIIANPLDWLVLAAFLATSLVAAQLLYRARREADVARQRAAEIDRLSALGAETLNAGRADAGLHAVAEVIRATLQLDRCELFFYDPEGDGVRLASQAGRTRLAEETGAERLVEWAARAGAVEATEHLDRTTAVHPLGGAGVLHPGIDDPEIRALVIPLRVRGRTVGVLRVARDAGLRLDDAGRRFLTVLGYYAALGVERVRLVSEAERADALREADRMKDAVLAAVSHDLRTPLTTIKAIAHDLHEERGARDERPAVIEAEADRLNAFVADLLDLSRLRSGAAAPAIGVNEAEDLVGVALERVAGRQRAREVRVEIDPDAPVLIGRFDFTATLRALVNLLENALKYSPPEAPVELVVRREGAALCFSVLDRGPGVPEAERERIFAPFYRAAGAPPDTGGTGLGLSLARGLAEAQAGTVTFAPRPGGGSIFTLSVPAAELAPFGAG